MDEGDALSLGADARCLVDEPQPCLPTAIEGALEIIYHETDVVYPRPTLGDESSDRSVRRVGLEELHERVAGGESGNPGPIGVVQRNVGHVEDVAIKGKQVVQPSDGDADVGDSRPARAWGGFLQGVRG